MASKGQDKWKGYLNYSLSTQDKRAIKKAVPKPEDLLHWLTEMVEFGVTFSFQMNKDGKGMRLTVTGKATGTDFDGYSVTSWGTESLQTLAIMHYLWCSGTYGSNLEGLLPLEDEDWW